ncbi:MAG: hypothetical protein WED81_04350 [Rhodothermales bacterium]
MATHLGEFWPFSIYPMFSRAGKPWSRAVVRDVSQDLDPVIWDTTLAANLPGEAYAFHEHGLHAMDLANFLPKTRVWDRPRIDGLRRFFGESELDRKTLLVFRVDGRITPDDSVVVEFVPYALLSPDSSILKKELPQSIEEIE